jgi:hypothetical protein
MVSYSEGANVEGREVFTMVSLFSAASDRHFNNLRLDLA